MGFLDKAKAKLTDAVDKHGDKISGGIDKAAAAADRKTGGKHTDKIAGATGKARDALGKLDKKNDRDPGPGTGTDLPDGPRR